MSSGKLAAELDDAATARGGLGGALGLSFRSHGASPLTLWRFGFDALVDVGSQRVSHTVRIT